MARSVNEAFDLFHTRLTPTAGERAAAASHRASVEAALRAKYDVYRFFGSGSYTNATSIRGFSDVDYFVSLNDKHKVASTSVLSRLRTVLKDRYSATPVSVQTPAVQVAFGSGGSETYEIVPSFLTSTTRKDYLYDIPAVGGGWMRSSPEAHDRYVSLQNDRLQKKLKPLIRFIKAWKYYNNVPISSFYLELRTAKFLESTSVIIYDWDVEAVLRHLSDIDLASMRDPTGGSGFIQCGTPAQKLEALLKIHADAKRATKARSAEKEGKTSEAFHQWNLVFNGQFPGRYE